MLKRKTFKRKCKICGERFETTFPERKWCSPECGTKLAQQLYAKQREKALRKRNREERAKIKAAKARIKSRSQWLKEAQAVFNRYIRLRDKDLPCISCGRFHQGQWHAGHYRSVGACPELRFDERNVNKQCAPCNNHKSGNAIEYRINLVQKIGVEQVEWLERQDHPPQKYTIDDCKEIIKHYKAKIKELE